MLNEHLKNMDEGKVGISAEEQRKLKDCDEDPDSLDDRDRRELERKLETLPFRLQRSLIEKEISHLEPLTKLAAAVKIDSKKNESLTLLAMVVGLVKLASEELCVSATFLRWCVEKGYCLPMKVSPSIPGPAGSPRELLRRGYRPGRF